MTIKNVAIAGATGNIGAAIVKALLAAEKFNVTALARAGSTTSSLDSRVAVQTVDYEDVSTVEKALKGQDAVISALNHSVLNNQRVLVDAAVAVGVQRFIPAEFGSDTFNPQTGRLPLFTSKKAEQAYLAELAEANKITYTIVISGPFLDFGIAHGFLGLDLKKRQLRYLDGGDAKFSTTTKTGVAKAVVGVLSKPDETKNRPVYVQEATLSLRELLKLAKQGLGEDGWTEIDAGTTEEAENKSFAALAEGKKDMGVFIGLLLAAIFRPGYGGLFEKTDNDLLGVTPLEDSDVVKLIKETAEAQAAS